MELKVGIILHMGVTNMSNSRIKDDIMQKLIDEKKNFKIIVNEINDTNFEKIVSKTHDRNDKPQLAYKLRILSLHLPKKLTRTQAKESEKKPMTNFSSSWATQRTAAS